MAKKGLFERMGLVEKIESDTAIEYEDVEYDLEDLGPDIKLEGVTLENLIADIYTENGFEDTNRSIFKVEEISNNLPATMTNEAKKTTVVGILGSFALTAEEVIKDANNRASILKEASKQITTSNTEIINAKRDEIENAKHLIEECEKIIASHEQVIANSTEEIETEIKRINALSEFIGGTE